MPKGAKPGPTDRQTDRPTDRPTKLAIAICHLVNTKCHKNRYRGLYNSIQRLFQSYEEAHKNIDNFLKIIGRVLFLTEKKYRKVYAKYSKNSEKYIHRTPYKKCQKKK